MCIITELRNHICRAAPLPALAAICLPIGAAYTLVTLDDCKFHECVDLTEFERDRVIIIHPPDGEVSMH